MVDGKNKIGGNEFHGGWAIPETVRISYRKMVLSINRVFPIHAAMARTDGVFQ
jgi:hypothetical protein